MQADPRSPEHGQYSFVQDLLRHVAYETLSKQDRRARHLAAARHLQGAFADEDEIVEVVASHYLEAYRSGPDAPDAGEIKVRAREMLTRAGDRAASLAAAREAQRYFEQAAELGDDAVTTAELQYRGRVGWRGAEDVPMRGRALLEASPGDLQASGPAPSGRARVDAPGQHRLPQGTDRRRRGAARESPGDASRRRCRRGRRPGRRGSSAVTSFFRAMATGRTASGASRSRLVGRARADRDLCRGADEQEPHTDGAEPLPREREILLQAALQTALDADLPMTAARTLNNLAVLLRVLRPLCRGARHHRPRVRVLPAHGESNRRAERAGRLDQQPRPHRPLGRGLRPDGGGPGPRFDRCRVL